MSEWYYQAEGTVVGPVSWEELNEKAEKGEIEQQTQVRQGADGEWIAAVQVAGLFGLEAEAATASSPDPAPEMQVVSAPQQVAEADQQPGPDVRRSPLALRPCSDCGTMVSKQASMCPECGRAFHESAYTARYGGEQPVVIFALISLLAIAFLFLSPLVVYRAAVTLAPSLIQAGEGQEMAHTGFGLAVVGFYVFAMLSCTFLGGAVGQPRMAYVTGCFLGLFFGPLGVFAAFAIDKRPCCPQCSSRLNGMAKECPHCHARLLWKVVPTWY